MKAYNKPEFYVTEFQLNDAVAAGCNTDYQGTQWTNEAIEVSCIVSETDYIFSAGISGCADQIDTSSGGGDLTYNTGDDWFFYNHTSSDCEPGTDTTCDKGAAYGLYYFWKGSFGGNKPDDTLVTRLNHLLNKATGGVITGANQAGNSQTWHGGLAEGALLQVYTNSF